MTHSYRRLLLGACALAAALFMAAPASAQDRETAISSVTQDQYGERTAQLSSGGDEASTGVGSLPFTGLDLAFMGGAAAVLLTGGLLVRRRLDPGAES